MEVGKVDQYLEPDANLKRLIKEYHQYGSLVIAFDFDNTVYDFHKQGHTYPLMFDLLRSLKKIGCYLICFTANEDHVFIRRYLAEYAIPCDAINENPPFYKSGARKIYYNALLDDRAGLISMYYDLLQLVVIIKQMDRNIGESSMSDQPLEPLPWII